MGREILPGSYTVGRSTTTELPIFCGMKVRPLDSPHRVEHTSAPWELRIGTMLGIVVAGYLY